MNKRRAANIKQKAKKIKASVPLTLAGVQKRTIGVKNNPQIHTFASISLYFKDKQRYTLEPSEFEFALASAIQTVHGDIDNKPDILHFEPIGPTHYRAIIRFKTIHYVRVVTSLILFGQWKNVDCRFEIDRLAQTPCFLAF